MMVAAPCAYQYATLDQLRRLASSTSIDHWLSPAECAMYARWRDSRRRATWLGGRLLAKRLILQEAADELGQRTCRQFAHIDIHSGPTHGRRERPRITVRRRLLSRFLSWSLSIAHTGSGVLVALAREPGTRVGVDLVDSGDYGSGFVRCWFTETEQRWLSSGQHTCDVATAWAVKEAVYKACNTGEGFAPRTIQVQPDDSGTFSCTYAGIPLGEACRVLSWHIGRQIAVLAYIKPSAVRRSPWRTDDYRPAEHMQDA